MRLAPIVLALSVAATSSAGQRSIISDTLYSPAGKLASGSIEIEWPAFTSADNRSIAAGRMAIAIYQGAVRIALEPTDTATPVGTTYTARYRMSDGSTRIERWAVPTSAGAISIAACRVWIEAGPGARIAPLYLFADQELPAGAIDGTNAVFTLANRPDPASSLTLFRNGVRQQDGYDYTISGATVTFVAGAVPRTGDTLLANYRWQPGWGAFGATPQPLLSVFGRSGAVVQQAGDYNFGQIAGRVALAQLDASGAASSTTFLRGDGAWAAPSASAVASVFGRTGAVSAQPGDYAVADIAGLQTLLDAKASAAALSGHAANNNNPHAVTALQVGAANALWNAYQIQSRSVAASAPADGQVLAWSSASSQWQPSTPPAAPVTSVFGRTGTITSAAGDYAFSQLSGALALSQISATGTPSSSTYLRGDGAWSTPPGAPVTSVFGRTGTITAAVGDYAFSQLSGTVAYSQLPHYEASITAQTQVVISGATHGLGYAPRSVDCWIVSGGVTVPITTDGILVDATTYAVTINFAISFTGGCRLQ